MLHRLATRLLPVFGRLQRPAAWVLMLGGVVSVVVVVFDLVALGNARLGTLLVAADLMVSGFSSVQVAENEADDGGQAT